MAKTKTQINLSVRIPHVILDTRDADPKLLKQLEEALGSLNARVKIIGSGMKETQHAFSLEDALEDADIWVVLSEKLPHDFKTIAEQGIVPVMLNGAHKNAENYDAVAEKGNAFLFPKMEAWYVYGSLIRAIENFVFPYDWKNIKTAGKSLV